MGDRDRQRAASDRPALSHVFAFSDRREAAARFLEDVLALCRERPHDDSVWFTTDGARFVIHDREDEPPSSGFVPWFQVTDLDGTYARAQAAGAVVGGMREDYFLAKDPDGRLVGVRKATT